MAKVTLSVHILTVTWFQLRSPQVYALSSKVIRLKKKKYELMVTNSILLVILPAFFFFFYLVASFPKYQDKNAFKQNENKTIQECYTLLWFNIALSSQSNEPSCSLVPLGTHLKQFLAKELQANTCRLIKIRPKSDYSKNQSEKKIQQYQVWTPLKIKPKLIYFLIYVRSECSILFPNIWTFMKAFVWHPEPVSRWCPWIYYTQKDY